jgi:hypothetical protein
LIKPPLPAITAGQSAFSLDGIENIPASPPHQHLAMRRMCPQQSIAKKAKAEIHIRFQLVMKSVDVVVNLAAFASACPWFVAALRGACHPRKSTPAMPKCNSGTGFLAAEMKEYDA